MEGTKDLEVAGVQDCTNSCIREQRRKDLLRNEPPTIGLDSMGEKTRSSSPP